MDYVPCLDERQVKVFDVLERGSGDMNSWMWGGTVLGRKRAEELEMEGNLKLVNWTNKKGKIDMKDFDVDSDRDGSIIED